MSRTIVLKITKTDWAHASALKVLSPMHGSEAKEGRSRGEE